MAQVNLPFYELMVSPAGLGQYGGPTAEQYAALQGKKTASALGAIDAVTAMAGRLIEQQQKIQAAYDTAQLAKAKATYFQLTREGVEKYQFSDMDPLEYQEAYEKLSQSALTEAEKALTQSKGRMILGGNRNRENLNQIDFDTWRMEQDSNMQSYVLQAQRKKMTEVAILTAQEELAEVRRNYTYLETFEDNMSRRVQDGTFSGEFASRQIDAARRIVKIGTYMNQAKDMYGVSEEGKRQALLWVSDPANFKDMDEGEYDRFKNDFADWTKTIMEMHENGKEKEALKAYDEYTIEIYTPGRNLDYVKQKILNDPRWMNDHLAPAASNYALNLKNQFLRIVVSLAGGADPNSSNPETLKLAQEMVHDPNVDEAKMTRFLYQNHGPGVIGFTAWDELMRLTRDKKKSYAMSNGFQAIDANTGVGKLLSYKQAEEAKRRIHTEYFDRMYNKQKPMTDEEITTLVQGVLSGAQVSALGKSGSPFHPPTPGKQAKIIKDYWGRVTRLSKDNMKAKDRELLAYLELVDEGGFADYQGQDRAHELANVVDAVGRNMQAKFVKWSGLEARATRMVKNPTTGEVAMVVADAQGNQAAFTMKLDRFGELGWYMVAPSATIPGKWNTGPVTNIGYAMAMDAYQHFRTRKENQPGSPAWKKQ